MQDPLNWWPQFSKEMHGLPFGSGMYRFFVEEREKTAPCSYHTLSHALILTNTNILFYLHKPIMALPGSWKALDIYPQINVCLCHGGFCKILKFHVKHWSDPLLVSILCCGFLKQITGQTETSTFAEWTRLFCTKLGWCVAYVMMTRFLILRASKWMKITVPVFISRHDGEGFLMVIM